MHLLSNRTIEVLPAAFTGCDTVSAIAGHGKTTQFDRFCAGNTWTMYHAVIRSGILYIYHAPGTTLGAIRYTMFSRKAAAGLIKPETLPPTEGAAAQHSLCAYLQTRDWMLLQSMSLDPSGYGWMVGVHGYEPVPTLWLLRSCSGSQAAIVKEIVATDGAAARRMTSSMRKLQRHYMR